MILAIVCLHSHLMLTIFPLLSRPLSCRSSHRDPSAEDLVIFFSGSHEDVVLKILKFRTKFFSFGPVSCRSAPLSCMNNLSLFENNNDTLREGPPTSVTTWPCDLEWWGQNLVRMSQFQLLCPCYLSKVCTWDITCPNRSCTSSGPSAVQEYNNRPCTQRDSPSRGEAWSRSAWCNSRCYRR